MRLARANVRRLMKLDPFTERVHPGRPRFLWSALLGAAESAIARSRAPARPPTRRHAGSERRAARLPAPRGSSFYAAMRILPRDKRQAMFDDLRVLPRRRRHLRRLFAPA